MSPFNPVLPDPAAVRCCAHHPGRLPGRRPAWRTQRARHAATGLLMALALGLAACGGGGGDAASGGAPVLPSAGTTGAFSQGTITGFGSIVVNGVRFDESSATVTDDAGNRSTASALRLGMRVEVEHGSIATASGANVATANAGAVRYGSLVLGKVSAKDAAANTLTVLDQVVDVTTSTVFSDGLSGGLSAVAVDSLVEVHGLVDAATGHITATRIEAEASATGYKLRGTVSALDSTAKTFRIGAAAISYAGLASTLANGMTLRVQLATTPSATSTGSLWVATSLGVKTSKPVDLTKVQVRGKVTAFTSTTAFSVDGLAVDASAATFPDGSTGLALGAAVEVKGMMANGVLVATQVELETRHQNDDDRRWHLFGAITAADATAKTVVVRGITVAYGDATTYVNGTVADLVVGRKVHVKGAVGSTRTQVQASTITFE